MSFTLDRRSFLKAGSARCSASPFHLSLTPATGL